MGICCSELNDFEFWTGDGQNLGGTWDSNGCNGTELIVDGVSNPWIDDYAWYCGNLGDNLTSVALKFPNGFGLYDMHGHLVEFTADWFDNRSPSGSDPWNSVAATDRLVRGGRGESTPSGLRASMRQGSSPSHRYSNRGFRLVLRAP